jgi:hypothetical protein
MMTSGSKLENLIRGKSTFTGTTVKLSYKVHILRYYLSVKYSIEGFYADMDEISEFTEILEGSLYTFTTDYIRKLFRDINTNLLRKFNNNFKKDEHGKNRNWREVDENAIRDLYKKVKDNVEELIH